MCACVCVSTRISCSHLLKQTATPRTMQRANHGATQGHASAQHMQSVPHSWASQSSQVNTNCRMHERVSSLTIGQPVCNPEHTHNTQHSGDYCFFPCGFRCNTLLFTLTSRVVCFFSRVCVLPLPRHSTTPSLLPFNWLFVFSAFSLICLLFLSSYRVSATAWVCVICNLNM